MIYIYGWDHSTKNILSKGESPFDVSRKTVRKWLEEKEPDRYKRAANKPSKLDPYKAYIQQRMEEGCLNAVVLYDEIVERGYTGKTTILRGFMHPLRERWQEQATVRLETPPGKQAQLDWGQFMVSWNGNKKRIYAFVLVLGYSRMMYLEFTENEQLETLMGCHERGFQYLGGRTETILYDNMKTVVNGVDDRGHAIWNERFAAFAAHHGFSLRRCAPYRAQTKGKVENGVGYVRKNFWPRVRQFTGLDDLNQQARAWMDTIANVRIHGTTHERPVARWPAEKLTAMNPFDYADVQRHRRKASKDCFVSYESNRYSVPFAYAGQLIDLQDLQNGILRLYVGDELIAEHPKATGKHQVTTQKNHFQGILQHGKPTVPQPFPRLVTQIAPEVVVRPLSVYEQITQEVSS